MIWLALLLGCAEPEPQEEPIPALAAGVAHARLPAPVGIGTAGFGPFGAPSSPSPFASIYPGTNHVFGLPEVKAVALTRGAGREVIFVRLDAVGMFSQLRKAIVNEASARVGRDLDQAVVIGSTHTHSGPGRVLNTGSVDGGLYDIIVDKIHPEFYERFVDTVAGTIVNALEDAREARVGAVIASCPDGHDDRRCEDGESYTNDDTPVILVERDGVVDAVVMAYPVHGTVLSIDDLHLSQDVSGAIETAVEDAFDHPVQVVMFNAWGADMSPADPAVPTRDAAVRDPSYDRMWRVGASVAEDVMAAIPSATWFDDPEISLHNFRVPVDRERIGYDDETFRYEWGAVYCGQESGSCEDPQPEPDIDKGCLPFNETYPAPRQVDVTTGFIGPLALVTFPGEPGTHLAERILQGMTDAGHDGDVLFLGYTQDYLGYSLLEEDWWYGGYEASGALWGPRQGEYLVERITTLWDDWSHDRTPADIAAPLEPFPLPAWTPYVPATALDAGTVVTDVPASVTPTDVVTVVLAGSDPWLGTPRAWLEDAEGAAVTRPGGLPTDSDDQNWDVGLVVDPPWNQAADARTFTWTVRLSPRSPLPGGLDLTGGTYTMVVDVPLADGTVQQVRSATFTVAE